ncbi:hypothetical protein [Streptomyces sporangiiformans]|uniref:DUF3592 domain-containing protein n=1 Tax=Streptomyces sporangiiformans TaxID=2315329 RepID=A0A505DKA6_9ACTN|nr:hypothetical protein [Streptomyces sporangiiformans]TPQ18311.1 hypothetical protein FGD71_031445 [Streptomyces sporangiiformans]
MDGLGWVCAGLVAFPVPFLLWFGVIPLWVDRRLRRSGREVMGLCRNVSTSEGRYSTSFEFSTHTGDRIIYISPLSGRRWGTPGNEALLVYDPASPWRRVRSRRELDSRSEAWASLWWLLSLEVINLTVFLLYLSY